MTFAEIFQSSFGNLPPVVRELARGLDEQETKLERLRVFAGFHDDWSPAHDRRMRSGVSAPVRWADKCGALNGMGDLRSFVEEMCAGMDIVSDKLAEIDGRLEEKRGSGRSRKVA